MGNHGEHSSPRPWRLGPFRGIPGITNCNIVECLESRHHDPLVQIGLRKAHIWGSKTSLLSSKAHLPESEGARGTAGFLSSSPLKLWGIPAPNGNTDGKKHRNARRDPSRVVKRILIPQAAGGRSSTRWRTRPRTRACSRSVPPKNASPGPRLPTWRCAEGRDERGHCCCPVGNCSARRRTPNPHQSVGLRARFIMLPRTPHFLITAPGGLTVE